MESSPSAESRFGDFKIITTSYKTVEEHCIDLDVLFPKDILPQETENHPCPVILRFHGGGLVTGSSLYAPHFSSWILKLAKRHSAIIVSLNYRLIPEASVQDVLDDVEDAWCWVRTTLPSWSPQETGIHVDVGRIMTAGDSAGGYLSQQVALSHPYEIRAVTAAYPLIQPSCPHFAGGYEKEVFGLPILDQKVITQYMDRIDSSPHKIVLSADRWTRGDLMLALIQHGRLGQLFPLDKRNYHPLLRIEDGDRFPQGGVVIWHGTEDSAVPLEGLLKLKDKVKESQPELSFNVVLQPGEHGFDHEVDIDVSWMSDALRDVVKAWLD